MRYNPLVLAALALVVASAPATGQHGHSDHDHAAMTEKCKEKMAQGRRCEHMQAPAPVRNAFEGPKAAVKPFTQPRISFNGAFTQSYQDLSHSNEAQPVIGANGVNANQLANIGGGFNLATANVGLVADVATGARVVLDVYLSSRHHNETWVKGGYIEMDASPIRLDVLDRVMDFTTVRVGHFEINYGDAHFRRTDNGSSIGNPFAEGLVLDAFTTEIGAEIYLRHGSLLAMGGITSGQNKGDVTFPEDRSWAFLSKAGVDHRWQSGARTRLMVSTYQNDNAGRATLYGGDRAGSAYWGVMENTSGAHVFTNGRVNPSFTEEIRALQVNPYVEFGPLELFGVAERASGRTAQQTEMRSVSQYAVDGLVRLLDDQFYLGARHNRVSGEFFAKGTEQEVTRNVLGGGWYLSSNVLLKGEYVRQAYVGYAPTSILHGGQFRGVVLSGVVAF
jgi:hypothetical protein